MSPGPSLPTRSQLGSGDSKDAPSPATKDSAPSRCGGRPLGWAALCTGTPDHQSHDPHQKMCCILQKVSRWKTPGAEPGPHALQTPWTPRGRRSLTDATGQRGRPTSSCTLLPQAHTPPPPSLGSQPGLSGCVTHRGKVFCLLRIWAHGERLPRAPVHMGRVPHAQQRRSRLPGRPRCRRWCPGVGVAPRAPRGEGTEARGSKWGRAQRSPAWWAAVGPSSSHGHRQAPGPARGCQSPGDAHSHLVLQTGSFRTHGASWQGDVPISPSAHVASGPCPSVRDEGQSWLTGSDLGDTMQDCAVLRGRVPRHVTAST